MPLMLLLVLLMVCSWCRLPGGTPTDACFSAAVPTQRTNARPLAVLCPNVLTLFQGAPPAEGPPFRPYVLLISYPLHQAARLALELRCVRARAPDSFSYA